MITKWVISHFPREINNYYEPFAGRGNILYRLLTTPGYKISGKIFINDLYTGKWFKTLQCYAGDWDFVPQIVNYEVYDYWKQKPESIERTLIEPIVCYQGNSWQIQGSSINDPNNKTQYYSPNYKVNWIRKLRMIQKLLQGVEISALDYREFLAKQSFGPSDFIYFDPPYNMIYDERKTYPNINHIEFLDIIKTLPCGLAISNYASDLYVHQLSDWRLETKIRVSTAKGRQRGHAGGRNNKVEHLWLRQPK